MSYELYGWRPLAGIGLWVVAAIAGLLTVAAALTPLLLAFLPFSAGAALVAAVVALGFWRGNAVARWAGMLVGLGIVTLAAAAVPAMLPCPADYVEQSVHECMRWGHPLTWAIWVLAVAAGGTVVIGSLLPGRRQR